MEHLMEDIIAQLTLITGTVSGYAWGIPSIVLLVGTGLYLTWRMRFVQFRHFGHATALVSGRYDKSGDPGEVTHFQALS
ncbi:MAG: sodium:alanine symporter family protein, partial [Gammaproteobacteria bacterium]|nr:sodium:alanine symporter family protein [Gammaproteobacteria bacterium]